MGTGRSQRHLREVQGVDSSGLGDGGPAPVVPNPSATATGTVDVALLTDANTVTGVTLTDVGGAYTSPPTVTFSAGAVVAIGYTSIFNGSVIGVGITNPGSYLDTSLPVTVVFSAP
jgi:hypothetical protein